MRKPKVENKYNIKPKDIEKAIVLLPDKLHENPFWRNNAIGAWCLSGGSGKGYYGGCMDSYCIRFYDNDAKSYARKIRLDCNAHEDMCSYNFKKFFDYDEIENELDLVLQEKLLSCINKLIDDGIISIKQKAKNSYKTQKAVIEDNRKA